MNAKEKAQELVDKMYEFAIFDEGAKHCALIAVDEIMKCTKYESPKFESDRFCENYWQEVKQEIEKL